MRSKILEVLALPDLSMHQYVMRYGPEARELAASALAAAAALVPPGTDHEVGVRYVLDPKAGERQQRLRIVLRLPAQQDDSGRLVGEHVVRPFYRLVEVGADHLSGKLGKPESGGVVHLVGQAQELSPAGEDFSWSPVPFGDPEVSRTASLDLDDLLDGLTSECCIDVLVRPDRVTARESRALVEETERLTQVESAFEAERRDRGSRQELARRRDPLARRCREHLEEMVDRLLHREVYAFTLRVVCADREEGLLVARSLARSVAGGEPFEVVAVRPEDQGYQQALEAFLTFEPQPPWQGDSDAPQSGRLSTERLGRLQASDPARAQRLVRLSCLLRLVDERTMLAMLRLPTSGGVPLKTIRIESELRASAAGGNDGDDRLVLGREMERDRGAIVPLGQLGKHAFVAGTTGSGKTTTVDGMLGQLWERYKVPFVVLESSKSEYRRMLLRGGHWARELRVFTPGNERLSPLRFNPFAVPTGCTVEEHIGQAEECFAGALPLWGPLPSLLGKGIRLAYERLGIEEDSLGEECATFPSMDDVLDATRKVVAEQGYLGEVKANVEAAIATRLEPLCRGSVGRLFGAHRSLPPVETLLRAPAVIELEALNADQKNLVALFLLTSLYRAVRSLGPSETLRTVIVIEEAHNLVGAERAVVNPEVGDPRGHATRLVVRLLAEARAYGVGLVIIDQTPAAVAPEVLKNTTVKIVHRITDGEDRERIAGGMVLDAVGEQELARLLAGEAFLYHDGLHRPVRIMVDRGPKRSYLDDRALRKLLVQQAWFAETARLQVESDLDLRLAKLKGVLAAAIRLSRAKGRAWNRQDQQWLLGVVRGEEHRFARRLGAYLADFGGTAGGAIGEGYQKRFRDLVGVASAALPHASHEAARPGAKTARRKRSPR